MWFDGMQYLNKTEPLTWYTMEHSKYSFALDTQGLLHVKRYDEDITDKRTPSGTVGDNNILLDMALEINKLNEKLSKWESTLDCLEKQKPNNGDCFMWNAGQLVYVRMCDL